MTNGDIDNSRIGILFVHGIVGSNSIFRFLIPHIPEECRQLWITLAGHGGDASAFSKASMAQWREQVRCGVEQLSASCDRMIIVGHSMGCLLALRVAAHRKVDGMLLLNAPLRIRVRLRVLTNIINALSGKSRNGESPLDSYGLELDFNPLHYLGWPRRYIELFRESRMTRKLVETTQIYSDIVAVSGGADELVSPESLTFFKHQPSCRQVCLPLAGHYSYSASDKNVICGLFSDLIVRIRTSQGCSPTGGFEA